MRNSDRRFTILAIVLAGVIASVLGGGLFNLWDTAIGLTILFILRLFPLDGGLSKEERLAYSCAKALAFVMIIGFLIDLFFLYLGRAYPEYEVLFKSSSPIYLGAVVLILLWSLFAFVIFMKSKATPANNSLERDRA